MLSGRERAATSMMSMSEATWYSTMSCIKGMKAEDTEDRHQRLLPYSLVADTWISDAL